MTKSEIIKGIMEFGVPYKVMNSMMVTYLHGGVLHLDFKDDEVDVFFEEDPDDDWCGTAKAVLPYDAVWNFINPLLQLSVSKSEYLFIYPVEGGVAARFVGYMDKLGDFYAVGFDADSAVSKLEALVQDSGISYDDQNLAFAVIKDWQSYVSEGV